MFKKTEAKGRDSIIRKMNISPENWNVPKKNQEETIELKNTEFEM